MDDSTEAARTPHSKQYLSERSRSFYWDPAYLRLMAERWQLAAVGDALDVGCGVGHWSFALGEVLPATARLVGVDREPEWVRRSTEEARERGLAARFRFERGSVERLPFPDGSCDLVTCQTLLMHVADPVAALREMVRVLRRGGLLLAVEPANRSALPLHGSLERTPDQVAELVRFFVTCERGKVACGEGDLSLGDRLPGLVAALGLRDLTVRQWECAEALFPPYATPVQQAVVADLRGRVESDTWVWDRQTTRRYFLAGGGAADRFDEGWRMVMSGEAEVLAGIEAGTFHCGGGGVMYVVWGRKP